jgi:hypothetical protein
MPYSDMYVELLMRGPFPGTIDPWAEAGRYFHQIHAGMIGALLEQLRLPLLRMGYVASREVSLQIAEGREPDMAVRARSRCLQTKVGTTLPPPKRFSSNRVLQWIGNCPN